MWTVGPFESPFTTCVALRGDRYKQAGIALVLFLTPGNHMGNTCSVSHNRTQLTTYWQQYRTLFPALQWDFCAALAVQITDSQMLQVLVYLRNFSPYPEKNMQFLMYMSVLWSLAGLGMSSNPSKTIRWFLWHGTLSILVSIDWSQEMDPAEK